MTTHLTSHWSKPIRTASQKTSASGSSPVEWENPISTELKDFADAVRGQGTPEVDGPRQAYRSQAICMAIFESERFNRPVSLAEIERGDLEGYQAEIDQALGID